MRSEVREKPPVGGAVMLASVAAGAVHTAGTCRRKSTQIPERTSLTSRQLAKQKSV